MTDPVGTVRVCQAFGTVAVYIKVDENHWRTTYVDPKRNTHLVPLKGCGDKLATNFPVVFVPKPVV